MKCIEEIQKLIETEKAKGYEATEDGDCLIDGLESAIYEIMHDEELWAAFKQYNDLVIQGVIAKMVPMALSFDEEEEEYQCPRCGSRHVFSFDDLEQLDHCGGCGQRLDWKAVPCE